MTSITGLSSVLMYIVYLTMMPTFLEPPSLGTAAPICWFDLLAGEFCCLVGSQMQLWWRHFRGLSGLHTTESCSASMGAPMLPLEETLCVSTLTEGLWELKGMEPQMLFSSVLPFKGKGWGMIVGSCRSTPVLKTRVYCWPWDLLCGSRSARERRDPLGKARWEHLFQQTGQSSEKSLKLWTPVEGYNESKLNVKVQAWVEERRVQYGRQKSKEALVSRMCTQKHVSWEMNGRNWSSKSSHRATSLLE